MKLPMKLFLIRHQGKPCQSGCRVRKKLGELGNTVQDHLGYIWEKKTIRKVS